MPSQDSYELGGYAEDDCRYHCTGCGRKIYSLELSGYCKHCWYDRPALISDPMPTPVHVPQPVRHGICPDCEGQGYMDGEVISLGRGVRSRKQDICMGCLGRGRV